MKSFVPQVSVSAEGVGKRAKAPASIFKPTAITAAHAAALVKHSSFAKMDDAHENARHKHPHYASVDASIYKVIPSTAAAAGSLVPEAVFVKRGSV
ncbi:MAG: hypothetical protein AAGJ35_01270 [Myxococcota bacterium]